MRRSERVAVLRQPVWQRAIGPLAAVGLSVLVLRKGLQDGGLLAVLGGLAVAFCVVFGVRSLQLRIDVGHDEVVVVNWLRRVRIPWDDLYKAGYDYTVWIRRRDGSEVRSSAFVMRPWSREYFRWPGRMAAVRLEELRKDRKREQARESRRRARVLKARS